MPNLHLQPGPADGLDVYIKNGIYSDINFGSEHTVQLGRANNQWVFTLMKFLVLDNEGGPIPPGSTINSAILQMYLWNQVGNNNKVKSYVMIREWSETLCNWIRATYPPGNWEIPGAMGVSDRFQISEDPSTTINLADLNTWISFDITKAFQKIVDLFVNSGIIFIGVDSPRSELWSSDYATDPTKRPILDIDYTTFDPFPIKSKFLRLNFP